ncbi:MAG: polyphosphate polymerase domain-containing protein [Oscillospiraceae bacterium]|nr:polyphosphate polymerase domain-containing protein [Oscillospiraceae bacterium]
METAGKSPIVVMKRYEMKYILDPEQTDLLIKGLEGHLLPDAYGLTSIASLYYDTPDYLLVRRSIEKPRFKEKIRLRSYGMATEQTPVYLELKRKADGIVYKRRVQTTIPLVKQFFEGDGDICAKGQINSEIRYFRDYYKSLVPACLIIYDRVAYFEPDGDLRLTLDYAPRYRVTDLNLTKSMYGTLLLPEGSTILEIKVQGAMPLWLADLLSRGKIYKTSFSKYGAAYTEQLMGVTQKG